MIHTIRKSKVSKVIACYLAMQLIVQMTQPAQLWALTSGPSQPEFNSFTPIGTSDMVNVSSGNFNYNIPIMDVGGYPLNLSYDSGITMDQEASWVGLGWNLNVGQIARDVRGLPDDFSGDLMTYENDMKTNRTVGVGINTTFGFAGIEGLKANQGIIVQNNNYEGLTFKNSTGIGYQLNDNVKIGVDISSSVGDGVSVSPSVSISGKIKEKEDVYIDQLTGTAGISLNSRKGLEALSLSFNVKRMENVGDHMGALYDIDGAKNRGGGSSYVSFNNNTFTPRKRAGIEHGNFSFAASAGPTVFGVDLQVQVNGFGSFQKINDEDRNKKVAAFGYENTEKGEGLNGILDFNREKDKTFNKHTTVVPVSNYTHDVYAIQGQGVGGMFRPYRSQVSYLYDHRVIDQGSGKSLGIKIGAGWNFYAGGKLEVTPSFGTTGKWVDNNKALGKFIENKNDPNPIAYEPSYFKMVGERRVDKEESLFTDKLHGNAPMKLEISGSKFHRRTEPAYRVKNMVNGVNNEVLAPITSPKLKRTKRDLRNQNIFKVTQKEAINDTFIKHHSGNYVKDHHTAGMKILKPDGSTYVYGETAYNIKKVEATFDVSGRSDINCTDGTVGFTGSGKNYSKFSDRYLNKITTPAYAHSYMLTSVLSSDYEDVDANGPSINDLGAYTLFEYKVADNDYKWRVPYNATKASYNEGLKSNEDDQKANYLYGEKELKYIHKIETKTHVAIFHLSNRKDARGARGEKSNGSTAGYMKKINKISLYSKPEYDQLGENASAIKEAHFVYDYSQCKNVENNLGGTLESNELSNDRGKLTLKKVFFTYRGSNMGRYTPYVFNYDGFNPDYNLKSYDIWGNYKPVVKEKLNYIEGQPVYEINEGGKEVPVLNPNFQEASTYCNVDGSLVAPEFPFVQQEDKKLQDAFTSSWTMTSIDLPSGGTLELEYESDDYQYVQNRRAMQMFMITGAHNTPSIDNVDHTILYNKDDHAKYIFAKLSDDEINMTSEDFAKDYLGDQINEPIQFRALLKMVDRSAEQYDYVSGYFEIDRNQSFEILKSPEKGTYAAIPMKFLKREGGLINSNKLVNPISKAGWYFGRSYLNREVYSLKGNRTSENFEEILNEILGSLGTVAEIFSGPNLRLQEKRSSRSFKAEKSWVRLLNPTKRKFGGGLRVKEIKMLDQWGAMVDNDQSNPNYSQFYGQQYEYTTEDGFSSGVASFEPNGSKENPFVEPFYDEKPNGENLGKDKLASPQASNYTEKPFGESFFPSSTVTYSRVKVRNLPRTRTENTTKFAVKKTATGSMIHEIYTTKDFPTIVDYTDITKANDPTPVLFNILTLGVRDRNHLTLSQGFTIETNDMNGRLKKQQVFPEGQNTPISEVEYRYNIDEEGKLNNKLPVIDKQGKVITDRPIGVHYEVVNEFRENKTSMNLVGVNMNVTGFLILIFPNILPIPLPAYSDHEDILRTATTTKVIHKSGILVEKIARDLGSEVSTKNIAWDATTGDVLLTKTINEYDDHYYNFNYPAHWYYDGMGLASNNIGITGTLDNSGNTSKFSLKGSDSSKPENEVFMTGDELLTTFTVDNFPSVEKLWVVYVDDDEVQLMNKEGYIINHECSPYTKGRLDFKIVRSGYRNQQMASMASVTSMLNPIDINNDGILNDFSTNNYNYTESSAGVNPKIVNASAVEYTEYWKPQDEKALPGFPIALSQLYDDILEGISSTSDASQITSDTYGFNPYLYNVKGDWRALKSYAYLTSRDANPESADFSTKSKGYLKKFTSFYRNSSSGNTWDKNKANWTFASQVTQYSPYGAELENKDALDRYSAAQYGYEYTLPVAVASNSKYSEIGFDGFEDYKQNTDGNQQDHFSFVEALGDNAERVDTNSHTGKYSIAVKNKVPATIVRNLNDCNYEAAEFECARDDSKPYRDIETALTYSCIYSTEKIAVTNTTSCKITGGRERANGTLVGLMTLLVNRHENVHLEAKVYQASDPINSIVEEHIICSIDQSQPYRQEFPVHVTLDNEGNGELVVSLFSELTPSCSSDVEPGRGLYISKAFADVELYGEKGEPLEVIKAHISSNLNCGFEGSY